jgi:putative transposase
VTAALQHLVPLVGVAPACNALGVNRASYYRAQKPSAPPASRTRPVRALSDDDRRHVLEALDSERFMDKTPREIYAELLDEDTYLCSVRTMYRILAEHGQVRERREQRRHPTYVKPELVACKPNQVWSWDITKIPGPQRGIYYSLYVVLDIYSRYVVGWLIARTESARIARLLLASAAETEDIQPGQLTSHSDRGMPMTAKSTAVLYADLGVAASYSRPRVSDDNPYSEAAFKTLKYRPEIPERFGSLEDARTTFTALFDWYNNRHYHTGIALLTPADVHHGRARQIVNARQRVLDVAYAKHPERFAKRPEHPMPPAASWINPPQGVLT